MVLIRTRALAGDNMSMSAATLMQAKSQIEMCIGPSRSKSALEEHIAKLENQYNIVSDELAKGMSENYSATPGAH